jgi:hypothetical protein
MAALGGGMAALGGGSASGGGNAALGGGSAALGGGSATGGGSGALLDGKLVGGTGAWPGPIAGVPYVAGGQTGVTDANGTFHYAAGDPVHFVVAGVSTRDTPGAARVSAYQLAADGACRESADLEHLLVLLDSLDADGDLSNGVALGAQAGSALSLSALTDGELASRVAALFPARTPTPVATAVDGFIRQMDGEQWMEIGKDTFTGTSAGVRSQGCASDGTSWYFSWQYGLERDDLSFSVQKSNSLAIPATLALAGSNHIGGIDVLNGTLYAPVEDGPGYHNPKIVLYDASNLTSGTVYTLSSTMLTQGVPWVAVDAPRGLLYVAQWDPTPAILVHDLATVTYQRSITLTPAIGRVQGAKVFEGMLYASTDDATKDIFKVNLETATVMLLFPVMGSGVEEEDLCFQARPDGSLMHTMADISSALSVELRHHQRTREPLRKALCP